MPTTAPLEIRRRQQFTTAGEKSGALKEALGKETLEDLQQVYLDCVQSFAGFDRVFGGNARRWENAIGAELLRRGVTEIIVRDCLGVRNVKVGDSRGH